MQACLYLMCGLVVAVSPLCIFQLTGTVPDQSGALRVRPFRQPLLRGKRTDFSSSSGHLHKGEASFPDPTRKLRATTKSAILTGKPTPTTVIFSYCSAGPEATAYSTKTTPRETKAAKPATTTATSATPRGDVTQFSACKESQPLPPFSTTTSTPKPKPATTIATTTTPRGDVTQFSACIESKPPPPFSTTTSTAKPKKGKSIKRRLPSKKRNKSSDSGCVQKDDPHVRLVKVAEILNETYREGVEKGILASSWVFLMLAFVFTFFLVLGTLLGACMVHQYGSRCLNKNIFNIFYVGDDDHLPPLPSSFLPT